MSDFSKLTANFSGAVKRAATAAVKGEAIFVDKLTKDSRQAICMMCDRKRGSRCAECLCFIEAKTRMATETCPLGHW